MARRCEASFIRRRAVPIATTCVSLPPTLVIQPSAWAIAPLEAGLGWRYGRRLRPGLMRLAGENEGRRCLFSSRPEAQEPDLRRPAWDESDRLAALDRYGILDAGREPGFDDIAELAADILEAPIAVVNFIASHPPRA